jgi:hypothetical protein
MIFFKQQKNTCSPSPFAYRNFPRRRAVRVRPETGEPPVFGKEMDSDADAAVFRRI